MTRPNSGRSIIRGGEPAHPANADGTRRAPPRDTRLVELQETVAKLKRTVAKLRQDNTELERRNRAAVTVIAELNAQLHASRGDEPTGTVIPLPKREQRRSW